MNNFKELNEEDVVEIAKDDRIAGFYFDPYIDDSTDMGLEVAEIAEEIVNPGDNDELNLTNAAADVKVASRHEGDRALVPGIVNDEPAQILEVDGKPVKAAPLNIELNGVNVNCSPESVNQEVWSAPSLANPYGEPIGEEEIFKRYNGTVIVSLLAEVDSNVPLSSL